MITSKVNLPVTLHRWTKVGKDAAGDETWSFVDTETVAEVQQEVMLGTREMKDGQVVSKWTVFFRPTETLTAHDEVTVPGIGRMGFDGDPWLARHPRTGQTLFWQARLKKVG